MENRKIIKNIAIGLICLSFLLSIGLNIFQHRQIRRLSGGVNDRMPSHKQSAAM
jgi:hypothetical protein